MPILTNMIRRLGRTLRPIRPGLDKLATARLAGVVPGTVHVGSGAFGDNQAIPARHTQDGDGAFPPVVWSNLPPGTQSVVVLVEDADIPAPRPMVHAIVHSIPARKMSLAEGEVPFRLDGFTEAGFGCGRNGLARPGWTAPSPPPGHGPHHYAFQVFALDATPSYAFPPGRSLLLRTIRPHMLAMGRLIGTYERI